MTELLVFLVRLLAYFFFWTMLGRVLLDLLSFGRPTAFNGLFRLATYPAFWLVRRITPRSVADGHIPVLSLPLLLAVLIVTAPG